MRNFRLQKSEDVLSLLQSECMEFKIDGNEVIINEDLTAQELWEMAYSIGVEKEKSFWTKPEIFQLSPNYAQLLKDAIDDYSKDSYIRVDSIKVKPLEAGDFEVIVNPTLAIHLFNVAKRYGELCCKKKETA